MTTAAVPSWSRGSSSWSASHTQPNAVTSSASNIPVTRSSSAPKLNTRGSTRGSSAWSLSTSAPADSVNGEQSTINAQNTATHRRSFDSLDTPPFASNGGSDNPLNPQFSGFVSVSVDNLRTALVKDKQILVFIVTVVTSISHWQLSKRFAQFEDLHIQFKSEFPSMTLPELPPPKSGLFDSNGLKAMAERREAVNTYIQDVMAHPALLESNTLKAFLSSDSDAELVGMTQSASKALEEMIVQLNRRLLKEQEKSKQFSQTLAKHQEEYQDLLQISTSQSSHIKELDTQIATLQDEIAAIMASKLQLEQQVAAAREETARVRSSQESGLKDLLRCRSALAEEQKQRTQWQAKEQQLEEQLAAITEELSRVKNSTEQAVEDACSKLKESLAQELESCSGDSSHVAEIQELLAEKREMESSYLTEIQRLQAEVEELQEMQSLSAPFPGSILHESTEEHTELLSRVQYLQQSNEALQNRHRLEVEALRKELDVTRKAIVPIPEEECHEQSQQQEEDHQRQLAVLAESLSAERTAKAVAIAENHELSKQVASLMQQLSVQCAETDRLKRLTHPAPSAESSKALEKELADTKAALLAANSQIMDLTEKAQLSRHSRRSASQSSSRSHHRAHTDSPSRPSDLSAKSFASPSDRPQRQASESVSSRASRRDTAVSVKSFFVDDGVVKYELQCGDDSSFAAVRYSELLQLHKQLQRVAPGGCVGGGAGPAEFPKKKLVGSTDVTFLCDRGRKLDAYLNTALNTGEFRPHVLHFLESIGHSDVPPSQGRGSVVIENT